MQGEMFADQRLILTVQINRSKSGTCFKMNLDRPSCFVVYNVTCELVGFDRAYQMTWQVSWICCAKTYWQTLEADKLNRDK